MSFTPKVYVPEGTLVQVNSLSRVKGQNEFPALTQENIQLFNAQQGPVYDYAVGVLVPAVVLILFAIVWCCFLCCAKICCEPKAGTKQPIALVFFSISGIASTIGWIVALSANGQIDDDVNFTYSAVDGDDGIVGFAKSVVNLVNRVGTDIDQLNVDVVDVNQTCTIDGANIDFPFDEITAATTLISDQVRGAGSGLGDSIQELSRVLSTGKSEVNQYLLIEQRIVLAFCIVAFFFTLIFTLSTVLRIVRKTPGKLRDVAVCLNQFSSIFVFLLGTIVILAIIIICSLLHVINTIGADICVPNPSANIIKIIAASSGFSGDTCASTEFQQPPFNAICYYQTCQGPDPFGDVLNVSISANQEVTNSLSNITNFVQQFLNDNAGSLPQQVEDQANLCIVNIDDAVDSLNTAIDNALSGIRDLLLCSKINPIYTKLVNDGFCNSVVSRLIAIWTALIFSSIMLMFAMGIYRIFNLREMHSFPQGQLAYQSPTGNTIAVAQEIKE